MVGLLSVGIAMSLCLRVALWRTRLRRIRASGLELTIFVVLRKLLRFLVYDLGSQLSAVFSTENLFATKVVSFLEFLSSKEDVFFYDCCVVIRRHC